MNGSTLNRSLIQNSTYVWLSLALHLLIIAGLLRGMTFVDQPFSIGKHETVGTIPTVYLQLTPANSPSTNHSPGQPRINSAKITPTKIPPPPAPQRLGTPRHPSSSPPGSVKNYSGTANRGNHPAYSAPGTAFGSRILTRIMHRIAAHRYYPAIAKHNHLEGSPLLEFSIAPDGSVQHISIVRSSGHQILDQAALNTITKAAPFPYYAGIIRLPVRYAISR